jgi:2-phosphosulfolactate phosphatase
VKVDVFFSPAALNEISLEGRAAVVIDVIRATTTMVEALANGARAIFPTVSTEDAVKLASSLGRGDTLLCGERKGLKVEGFDLGNSPGEYAPAVVKGKQLVMTTTNGTRAFKAVEDAERILVAAFLNLSAVTDAVRGVEDLVVVCAGREDRFSLDDALCAGHLLRRLVGGAEEESERSLNDAARVVLELVSVYPVDANLLRSTAAGRALSEVGLDQDLEVCARVDRYALVPEMRERQIRIGMGQSQG